MTTPRDAFLQAVGQAVTAGNRPGAGAEPKPRDSIGYQGSGPDPVRRFCDELAAVGGQPHLVGGREAAISQILDLVQGKSARHILVGRGTYLDPLQLPDRLRGLGLEVTLVEDAGTEASRDTFFAADVGISGVDYLIAETGSVALFTAPAAPRSLSLLPPVHIAVADRTQLLPDLFDLFDAIPAERGGPGMPSCLSIITGPSKTGDIELKLVTGVHGPGDVHVVLVTG